MNQQHETELFISCECGCDVMKIEKLWEDDTNEDDLFWLCIYRSSMMGFWQRAKQSLHYFRYGEFSYNDMTIKRSDIDKMIAFFSAVKDAPVEKSA